MDHNENTDFVGNVDATAIAAITASTPPTSDNSDNIVSVADKTVSVNSDVATVAASITSGTPTVSDDSNNIIISATTAGTPTISDHSNNTATVGMDVAPVAGVITTSNDSNNTVTVSSDMSVAGATTAGTPTISDHSDNTATHPPSLMTATTPWQQWLSTVVGATTAGTPTVSNHSDNIATVGRDVAPVAGAITAGTPTVSDDSDNTVAVSSDVAQRLLEPLPSPTTAATHCHLVVMMITLLGLEGSQPQQLSSLPAHPSSLMTATMLSLSVVMLSLLLHGSWRFSAPAAAIAADLPNISDDNDNTTSVGGDAATAAGFKGSQPRQLALQPTHPTSPMTVTTLLLEEITQVLPL